MAYLGVPSGRVSTVRWPICMSDGASEVQGECRAELARAMLSRSLSEVQGECRAELARAMLSRSLHSRCISNAAQRYDIGIAVHEYFTRNFSLAYLQRCNVAMLQFSRSYSHTPKHFYIYIYIYIYINIELIFDFRITYFGTATLQQLQQQHCFSGISPTDSIK